MSPHRRPLFYSTKKKKKKFDHQESKKYSAEHYVFIALQPEGTIFLVKSITNPAAKSRRSNFFASLFARLVFHVEKCKQNVKMTILFLSFLVKRWIFFQSVTGLIFSVCCLFPWLFLTVITPTISLSGITILTIRTVWYVCLKIENCCLNWYVACYIRIRHKFQFWPESIEGFCF